MNPAFIPWLILFLPLGAAAIITLFTRNNRTTSAALSIGAVLAGFVLSIIFVSWTGWRPATPESVVNWLTIGDLQIDFGLHFDPLSLLMMLLVTGVASAIHIYSWGYMHDDPGFSRYFACLSLFTFSMLGIVLANNFVQLFIFWELVGVSSYLLVGFWFERPSAADAGKKAFITNRLGDFGFLLGILLVWALLGSVNFEVLRKQLLVNPQALGSVATTAGLLIFCGAMGKSAQFPLHVWLPDAMEGPTPVSALIHAATMVAAGVYMLCRVFFLLNVAGSSALPVIACIGGFTALLAAVIAIQQNDIKRILAYSTLSQLGYMVMAVGLAGPSEAMYHLTTHAFFKALLFLGAGSIILALHHEQDIWKMGALRRKMPVTFWTFLAGTFALAGVPPFSGFFSKDSILARALQQSNPALKYGLFFLGVIVAALTVFYMFRLVFVVFQGDPRSETASHAHESPPVIVWPLRVLAVFSTIAGVIGIEALLTHQFDPEETVPALAWWRQLALPFIHSPWAVACGLFAAVVGFGLAYTLYLNAAVDPLPGRLGKWSRAMRNRFYFDEIYEGTVIRVHELLASFAAAFDRWIISGFMVRGTHGTTELVGRALRLFQTGNLQGYALMFVLGVALLLALNYFFCPVTILSAIICIPFLAALVLAFVPRSFAVVMRGVAIAATFLSALLAVVMFLGFDRGNAGYQFVNRITWVESLGISYHVGVDGINVGLVLMGAIVAFAAACLSWEIEDRQKEFYILLLVMTGGILGAFASLDLFFFYFFHELALVPTFIMIGVWGRGDRKNYATFQITLYLSIGALIALVGLIALYLQSGARTFDIPELVEYLGRPGNRLSAGSQNFIFPLLLFGFGILVSLWPFHSWAPLGYGSAPTPTAMLHAGVLKKFGLYGLIRIALPLMPEASQNWAHVIAWLCLGNLLYCGWVAMKQKDFNWLIGYSSVAHMGFVFLGIASLTVIGVTGAVLVMIAHGLLAALTFGLSGYIYHETGTLQIDQLGGLLRKLPFIGTALIMAAFAGCGLPGFANFAGEITVFFGAWKAFPLAVGVACWGALIVGAIYMLRAVRNILHGPLAERWQEVADAPHLWRKLPFVLLLASLLIFGCFPRLLTDKIKLSVDNVLLPLKTPRGVSAPIRVETQPAGPEARGNPSLARSDDPDTSRNQTPAPRR